MPQKKMERITTMGDLPADIRGLCGDALTARKHSYSPYSQFKVGAAIQLQDGSVVTGCNVENASYGLAICAERTACVKAVSMGHQEYTAIAIAADLKDEFVGPCGACRQFMCEFHPALPIYLVRVDGVVQVTSLAELLPESFTPKRLDFAFHKQGKENQQN